MGDRYNYLIKFIIIGDAAAGKSCLLHRFIDNKCMRASLLNCALQNSYPSTVIRDSTHTIGVEFGSKIVEGSVLMRWQGLCIHVTHPFFQLVGFISNFKFGIQRARSVFGRLFVCPKQNAHSAACLVQ